MNIAPLEPGCGPSGRLDGKTAKRGTAYALALAAAVRSPAALAHAAPFIWDDDGDRIDDRIESVNLLGFRFASRTADTLLRQRIERRPRAARAGLRRLRDLRSHPDVRRSRGARAARHADPLPLRIGAGGAAVSRASRRRRRPPTSPASSGSRRCRSSTRWTATPSPQSACVIPASACSRPGRAPAAPTDRVSSSRSSTPASTTRPTAPIRVTSRSLGHCLGGASFTAPDSALDTPPDGSENPVDRGDAVTQSHGTHVASIAVGTGGPFGLRGRRGAGRALRRRQGAERRRHRHRDRRGARLVHPQSRAQLGRASRVHGHRRDQPLGLERRPAPTATTWPRVSPTARSTSASSSSPRWGTTGARATCPRPPERHACSRWARSTISARRSRPTTGSRTSTIRVRAADNGDLSSTDELKPDLLAPGVAILGADGS